MHVENRPPQLCGLLCVCVPFLSLLLMVSLCLATVIFLRSKHFFLNNSGGEDTYFYIHLLLILSKSSFCDTELSQPLFHFFYILYQNSTMLYLHTYI